VFVAEKSFQLGSVIGGTYRFLKNMAVFTTLHILCNLQMSPLN